LLDVRDEGEVAVAGSTSRVHWVDPDRIQTRHGAGITGDTTVGGRITTWSLVRGAWEVRIVRVESLEGSGALEPADGAVRLRIGGWALAGEPGQVVISASAEAASARLG